MTLFFTLHLKHPPIVCFCINQFSFLFCNLQVFKLALSCILKYALRMLSNLLSLQCEQIIQHLNHKIPGVNTAELCQVSLDTSTYKQVY